MAAKANAVAVPEKSQVDIPVSTNVAGGGGGAPMTLPRQMVLPILHMKERKIVELLLGKEN